MRSGLPGDAHGPAKFAAAEDLKPGSIRDHSANQQQINEKDGDVEDPKGSEPGEGQDKRQYEIEDSSRLCAPFAHSRP